MPELPAADCWFLTGPTAGGKTAVSLHLARLLNAEVISLDSMAVYRGMDIGTAKPTLAERTEVPHHLIDVVEPAEEFSVAQYLRQAHELIVEIRARGRQPLFVGGTPLYLKALLRGLFEGPAADLALRQRLSEQGDREGSESLHRELTAVDPVAAARLHPRDARRIIRALEVFHVLGQRISQQQSQFADAAPAESRRVFALNWPREELNARIDARVDAMFAAGLVEETRLLLTHGNFGRTASQAVGYREVAEYLAGQRDLPETVQLVKTRTRQFAKRQMTWFRSLSECRLINLQEPLDPSVLAQAIYQAGQLIVSRPAPSADPMPELP